MTTAEIDALKENFERKGYKWYFIEGALDFVRNGTVEDIIAQYGIDDRKLISDLINLRIEHHIKNYQPKSWVEPIRVPIGYVDYDLCMDLTETIIKIKSTEAAHLPLCV